MQERKSQNAINILSRLKSALNISSDIELAEALKIKQSTLSGWKSRGIADYEAIFTICEEKSISIDSIIHEISQIENIVNEPSEKFIKDELIKIELGTGIMRVPLVSQYAYAGYLGGYSDVEFMESLPTIPFIIDREYKGVYMAFEVRGDSMDDGSRNSYIAGDILLSRQVQQTHWQNKLHINRWDFIIVHKTDGILLKKIISHIPTTGDIIAHSLNPDYDDIQLNLSDVVQLFNVVKVERKK
jgi:phage repressor protein C with HTH and peptisase S24 domain